MEYIAAMDFEVDNVIPVREPQVSKLFVSQKSLSETEYDDFIDDMNREMTNVSILTELGHLPLLIRRNSSKRSLHGNSDGKENSNQENMTLSRANTLIIRTNSRLSEANRDISKSRDNSVSGNDVPAKNSLQSVVLSPGCSLERSLTVIIPTEVNNSGSEKISCEKSSLIKRNVSNQEKENHTQTEEIKVSSNLDHNKENHPRTLSQDLMGCQASLENIGKTVDPSPVSNNGYLKENISGNNVAVSEPEASSKAITTPEDNGVHSLSQSFRLRSLDQLEEPGTDTVTEKQAPEAAKEQNLIHTAWSARDNNFHNDSFVYEDATTRDVSSLEHVNSITMEINSSSSRSEDILPETLTFSASHNSITMKRSRYPSPTQSENSLKRHKSSAQDPSYLKCGSENPDGLRDKNDTKIEDDSACRFTEPKTYHDPAHYQLSSFLMKTPRKKYNTKMQSRQSCSSVHKSKRSSVITRHSVSRLTLRHPNRSATHIFRNKVNIFKAVEEGNLEIVRDLMSDTGPAIRIGKIDSTLLHIAASSNQSDVVIYLLKFINPNVINKDGQTPAHVAAVKGHTQILKMLMADEDFHPNKQDKMGRTFRYMLLGPLFEAILNGDKNKTRILIQLGADPDCHAGKNVEGILSRELNVTSARQLAHTLHGEEYLEKITVNKNVSSSYQHETQTETHLRLPKFFCGKRFSTKGGVPVQNSRGYACILNFKSFIGNPELEREASDLDSLKFAKVLEGMGFSGHVHTSLTAEQVKRTLQSDDTKKMLDNAQCAIFVISSHSINKNSFLTTDMKLLTTDWLMNLFKDSECPQLKSKPKLFIFDFNSGFYIKKMTFDQEPKLIRMEEPLHDMMSISSESNSFNNCPSQNQSFMRALCRTFKECSQLTLLAMYRELLKEFSNEQLSSVPELQNFGFPEKFAMS